MTNPDKIICYECMCRGRRIPGTIRIRHSDVEYALYYCANHSGAAHIYMLLLDILEWDISYQADGFIRTEEPS